jgi:hypothetical protein
VSPKELALRVQVLRDLQRDYSKAPKANRKMGWEEAAAVRNKRDAMRRDLREWELRIDKLLEDVIKGQGFFDPLLSVEEVKG